MSMLLCEPSETALRWGWLLTTYLENERYKDLTITDKVERCMLAWHGWYNVIPLEWVFGNNHALYSIFVEVANKKFELLYHPDEIAIEDKIEIRWCA